MEKKVLLVTGASSGIGRACADFLCENGWTVVGTSRRGIGGAKWAGLTMDVDDDSSVNESVQTILKEHGRIDALLACAGFGIAGSAEKTPLSDAMAQMQTNFWGTVRVVNAVLPTMRSQKSGRLIFMSSIGGAIGIPFQAYYSASKFALEGYGEALAYEVEPFDIHVTLVQPGNFKTDFTHSRRKVVSDDKDAYKKAQEKAISVMERDEENGAPASELSALIGRVLASSKPKRRVSVGKVSERFGLLAKRILPFRLFEMSARGSLGV